ncbi:MAG: M3 family metallopeptidase [Bdellovibrionota bacterium]
MSLGTTPTPQMISDNPLIASRQTRKIPDWMAIKPEHVKPLLDYAIEQLEKSFGKIINVAGQRTFKNTVQAFDDAISEFTNTWNIIGHLKGVKAGKEVFEVKAGKQVCIGRDFALAVKAEEGRFGTTAASIFLNADLFEALTNYNQTRTEDLGSQELRLLSHTIKNFKKNGVDKAKDLEVKERIEKIFGELAELEGQFARNASASVAENFLLIADEVELAGLPADFVRVARAKAEEKGLEGFVLDVGLISAYPALIFLTNRDVRKSLYKAMATIAKTGDKDNIAVITRLLELRKTLAQELGFKDYADYQTSDRLAKTGLTAIEFEESIIREVREKAREQRNELSAFAAEYEGDPDFVLNEWDKPYYLNLLKQTETGLNEAEIRQYHKAENVVPAIFKMAETLYGISFELVDQTLNKYPVWDKDVDAYEIYAQNGQQIGLLYVDLFARTGQKREGAWFNTLNPRLEGREQETGIFVGGVHGNFSPPEAGKPALLSSTDVRTFFHEVGHALEFMLALPKYHGLLNVPWDGVEVSSQLHEAWRFEDKILEVYAKHFETGERLPVKMIEALKKAQSFQAAPFIQRQAAQGYLDLLMHTIYDPAEHGDLGNFARKILGEVCETRLPEYDTFVNRWGHMSSNTGYAAGYYSYLWANILEAMILERFKSEGMLNPALGSEFRRTYLEPADSSDKMGQINRFLGRDENEPPDVTPYLRREGVLSNN